MDTTSESIAAESVESGDDLVPQIITDEFFEDVANKTHITIKALQGEQKYELAMQLQHLYIVASRIKDTLADANDENKEMQKEVDAAKGRIAEAMELSQVSQDTIQRLKQEIEDAWKQTDAAQIREQAAQEQMYIMKDKLEKLQKETEKLTSDKKDVAEELGSSLAKHKDGILRERDRLNAEVEELNRRLQIQRLYTDEMEKKRMESEQKNKELYKLLDDTSSEAFREKKLMESLRIQLQTLQAEVGTKVEEAKYYQTQAETYHKQASQSTLHLIALKADYEKINETFSSTNARLRKLNTEYQEAVYQKNEMQKKCSEVYSQQKYHEIEIRKLTVDNAKLNRLRDMLMKRIMNIETQKAAMHQDALRLKNAMFTIEKERAATDKAFQKQKKGEELIARERDVARKDLQKANGLIGEKTEQLLHEQQQIKTMENEMRAILNASKKHNSGIAKIEKDRDKYLEESQVLADKVEMLQDEMMQKEHYIAELKEQSAESKTKLLQVQQLFETARSERNAFQRDLQACTEDRDDVKERLRICSRQREQLKEDIATKERELIKASKSIEKVEKNKMELRLEIQNLQTLLQHTRSELKEKKMENERLYKTLSDDELKLLKLRVNLDNITNEKDLIGTQMIRRNDEISLLNEKLQIIQMALDRGEAQYNKRLDDIRLLKIEIGHLRSQRNLLTRGLANTADMRQEVLQLNRVLTQERVKVKALEQEMMSPMNIHRWRKLGGEDPSKMDLILKVQTLQRRILGQTVLATEREQTLQESHKLYLSLKQFMLLLPSHKVKERLNSTQRALITKTKKLKALAAEVNAKEIEVKAKECTIEVMKKSLVDTKQELIKEKKEKQRVIEEIKSSRQTQSASALPGYRTLGAGYKVPTTDGC